MQSHREWFAERFRGSRLIALGEPRAGWRAWRARTALRRLRHSAFALAAGTSFVCTAGGVALAMAPAAPLSATLSAGEYRIGDAVLHSSNGSTYTGDAVLVIHHTGIAVRAAASATIAGQRVVAVCVVNGDVESCTFRIGATVVRAQDLYRAGQWMRRYSDGRSVTIAAATNLPVPFPVGR